MVLEIVMKGSTLMDRFVYADNAATTKVSKKALDAMLPYFTEQYGNPSSAYRFAYDARRAVENARAIVAKAIGASPYKLGDKHKEVFFTAGGTESDNWAIKGACEYASKKGKHIITTAVEHHAVMHTLEDLKKKGYDVTFLPVNEIGQISLDELRSAVRPDTALITVIMANNEIGTIQNVKEIGAIARENKVLFHTDAVQAVGHIPVNVEEMNIDMLSLAAHKFRGPKGVGALYVKRGIKLPPLMHGGGHEDGRRSGTENVPGIAGLGAALEEAYENLQQNMDRITGMRNRLVDSLLKIPYSRLTGDPVNRLPGIASFVFEFIEGESIVLALANEGICASSGSACSSGSLDPSHVLLSIGLPHEIAHGSVRLSINEDNTDEDIDHMIEQVPKVVHKLRLMSPLWEE